MVTRVENDGTEIGHRLDPEVQAGRALRRLRLARDWSQEDVADRMTAYGYDFHQTMIAKIESAQRPLRVRELADFAALYGVVVQDLIYPPAASLTETDREMAELAASRDAAEVRATEARQQLEAAREAVYEAEVALQAAQTEAAVLKGRLAFLQAERLRLVTRNSVLQMTDGITSQLEASEPAEASIAWYTGVPMVLRILLGAQLRRLREAAQLTQEEAALKIRVAPSTIRRLESGSSWITEGNLSDLLTFYQVADTVRRESLMTLARRANAPSWWLDYSDILPRWLERYLELEEAATQISSYEFLSVPALLQIEDYARAFALLSREGIRSWRAERMVQLRMARQEILDRPDAPHLWVVLDQAVLQRDIGGPSVMRRQLLHLIQMAERPNVTIQVAPLDASGVAAAAGIPFTVLRFAEAELDDVVYLEQLAGSLYLDKPSDLDCYAEVMNRLRSNALTPQESVQFLREFLKKS